MMEWWEVFIVSDPAKACHHHHDIIVVVVDVAGDKVGVEEVGAGNRSIRLDFK